MESLEERLLGRLDTSFLNWSGLRMTCAFFAFTSQNVIQVWCLWRRGFWFDWIYIFLNSCRFAHIYNVSFFCVHITKNVSRGVLFGGEVCQVDWTEIFELSGRFAHVSFFCVYFTKRYVSVFCFWGRGLDRLDRIY